MSAAPSGQVRDPLIPEGHFPGFRVDQRLLLETPRDLYGYMDGGAELYLSYKVSRVRVLDLLDDADRRILIELYEFENPGDAFGVYTFDTSGDPVTVGQRATFSAGLLKFWKGTIFCRILMIQGYQDFGDLILDAGRYIADQVGEGTVPEIVGLLPEPGRLPDSTHYFYHQMVLNNLYYLSGENLLGLEDGARAVLARYSRAGQDKPLVLIVVGYPGDGPLDRALDRFKREYIEADDRVSGSDSAGLIVAAGEGGFFGLRRAGPYLMFVFEAETAEAVADLLGRAAAGIPADSPR